MQSVRQLYSAKGLSAKAADILMASWRKGTKKQYKVYIERWRQFCITRHFNFSSPDVTNVLEFLTQLFQDGGGYSSINTARCALSTFIHFGNVTAGCHPLIVRFLKGVFNLRPTTSRYTETWDVELMLTYLKNKLSPAKYLDLKLLTFKTIMLMLLVSAKRGQAIHGLDLSNMVTNKNNITFHGSALSKESRPRKPLEPLVFHAYPPDKRLCVKHYLLQYLARTESLRQTHTQVFLSYRKPHLPISRDTLSRYVKTLMTMAGIDSSFKPHSTRSASTSRAFQRDVPLDAILSKAGWTQASTFATYYKKPVSKPGQYQAAVLHC